MTNAAANPLAAAANVYADTSAPKASTCAGGGGSGRSSWNGWSPSVTNTRFQTAEAAGLSIDQVRKLKLKWAFGFEGDAIDRQERTDVQVGHRGFLLRGK